MNTELDAFCDFQAKSNLVQRQVQLEFSSNRVIKATIFL